jgi:hypothetical protein
MIPFALLGLPLFSSEVFMMSPFAFLGLPLFSSEVFVMSPFVFLGLPLLPSEVFVISYFAFLGLPLFYQMSFLMIQLMRGVRAHLYLWLRLFAQKYLSNVKLTLLAISTMHCHDF